MILHYIIFWTSYNNREHIVIRKTFKGACAYRARVMDKSKYLVEISPIHIGV